MLRRSPSKLALSIVVSKPSHERKGDRAAFVDDSEVQGLQAPSRSLKVPE